MENDPLVTEEQEEQQVPEMDMSFFREENINDITAPSVPEVQAQELDTAQSTVPETPPAPESPAAGDTSPSVQPVAEESSEEMVPYGEQMVPKSAVEYKTNMFGQEIPFLKPEYEKQQREQAQKKDGTGVSQLPIGYNSGPMANVNRVGVASAAGVADTGTDIINMFLPDPLKMARPTKYEDEVLQTTRVLAGFIIPEMVGMGAMKRLAMASHAKVGWRIGNAPWMQFLGNRGIEAGVTAFTQGNKEEVKMPGNEFDMIHGALPSFMKWMVPETMRSSHLSDPDEIHGRNLTATMGLGFMIPFIPHAYKMAKGRAAVNAGLDVADPAARAKANLNNEIQLIGNNSTSQAFIESATPKPRDWRLSKDLYDSRAQAAGLDIRWDDLRPEQQADNIKYMKESDQIPTETFDDGAEAWVDYSLDQDSALDELGRYNLSINPDANVPLKGVNDLYDFNEIGMRTVDNYGVVGAAIDQARIVGNFDTVYGRLRNMLSPAALKYVKNNLDSVDDITLGLSRSLDEADDIRVQGPNWSLTNDDLVAAGDNLVVDFIDPSMDVNGIRRMFADDIKILDDGTEVLKGGSYNKMLNVVVKMGREFNDMTVARAQAYVGTSLAGEVSDLAEAARYSRDNNVVVAAAQEKILDNMKYIMRLKGSTNYYKNMKTSMVNMWDEAGAVTKQAPEALAENYPKAMETLNREINKFANDLQWTFNNYPELGEAIMELYEIADGRVFDISTVNSAVQKSLGGSPVNMLKAMDKDMPNLIGQATRANWYNSLLSPLTSPVKAVTGNLGGILDEPVSYFAGALVSRDMKAFQKGWYAYRSMSDIRTKALPLMGRLFEKAVSNDQTLTLATDLDYVLKTDRKINSLMELGRAEAAKGNTGIAMMVDQYLDLQALANDPVMKFSSNAMTGLDGLPQSMAANAEAKFRALEEMQRMVDLGEEVSGDLLKKTATREYDSMFDNNGLLKDKAAQYSADRIALRVDSPLYQRFNNMIKDFPFMRLMMPFPGMQANVLKLIDETSPFFSFATDVQQLATRSMDSFAENPALMREILETKGFDVNTMDEVAQIGAIHRLKLKTVGRRAIGRLAYGTFWGSFLGGNIVGAGLMDKQADQTRRKLLDLPYGAAIKIDGRWVEFKEILGPGYGAWASTLATALDNASYIGQGETEKIAQKLIFALGASLEEESGFGGLKPMFDLFAGNTNSATRWLASQANTRIAPMGSLRNQMGEILVGGTREVENDLISIMGNKNKLLDLGKPEGDVPYYTNPVTGRIQNQYDPFTRFFNTISPVKLPSKADENLLFLKDIGYDYTTLFKQRDGVPLLSNERSQLFTIMGEDGIFKKAVTRIRKQAEAMDYLAKLQAARQAGANSSELSEFMQIEQKLRDAAKEAENIAYEKLDYEYKKEILERSRLKKERENAASMGAVEFIEQLPTR